MKNFLRALIFGIIWIPLFCQAAAEVTPKIILSSIKQIHSQEKSDEIYFLVSDLSAKHESFYTIPGNYPYFPSDRVPRYRASSALVSHAHWKENELSSVRNTVLWQRPLKAEEATEILISLVEADAPPWDLDDTLGTLKIKFINHDNKLKFIVTPYSNIKIKTLSKTKGRAQYLVQVKASKANYQLIITVLY